MRKCPPCNGTGKEWGIDLVPCQVCKGERCLADPKEGAIPCHWCNGNGRKNGIYPVYCPECDGRGFRTPNLVAELAKELGVKEPAPTDGPCVVSIEAGKPHTAHVAVTSLLSTLTGTIRICDPYYGMGSLLRLAAIAHLPIQFLTHKADGKEKLTLPKALSDFIKEYPSVEFRQHQPNDLHDRFIVCTSALIFLGHGLKDVGNKESFVIRLSRNLASDMIDQVIASFDAKWANANPLP